MNKIYKVIWSKVRNCCVAVSEIAKGHGKSCTVVDRAASVCGGIGAQDSCGMGGARIAGCFPFLRRSFAHKGQVALALAVSLWLAGGGVAAAGNTVTLNEQPTTSGEGYTVDGSKLYLTPGSGYDKLELTGGTWTTLKIIYAGYSETDADLSGYSLTVKDGATTGVVYGGYDGWSVGSVRSNSVTVAGTAGGSVYGGRGEDTVSSNSVTVAGTAGSSVYGGWCVQSANSNSVTVERTGTVEGGIYGGWGGTYTSELGVGSNNVTVAGVAKADVYGGSSMGACSPNIQSSVNNNTVTVEGTGTVGGRIFGGYSNDAVIKVIGNTVTVAGTVKGDVYGGYSYNFGSVKQNAVHISGGTIGDSASTGAVCGGYMEFGDGEISGNTVTITGGVFVSPSTAIYGARCDGSGHSTSLQDNAVRLGGTTTGLESAALWGAYHGGESFFNGGNTLSVGTVQTAGAPGAAWQGADASGALTNSVGSITGFDVIAINTVCWNKDLPALKATGEISYTDWDHTNNDKLRLDLTNLSFVDASGAAYTPKAGDAMTLLSSGTDLPAMNLTYNAATQTTPATLTAEGVACNTRKLVDGSPKKFYSNEGKAALTNENKAVTYTVGTPHIALTDRTGTAGAVTLYAQPSASDAEAGYLVNNNNLRLADGFKALTVADGTWDKLNTIYAGYSETGDISDYSLSVTGGTVFAVYGAHSDAKHGEAEVSGNTVNITGGTITSGGEIMGARLGPGRAAGNTVNISGGTFEKNTGIYGVSAGGAISNNTVDISGNTVNISGGTFDTVGIHAVEINMNTKRISDDQLPRLQNNAVWLSGTTRGLETSSLYGAKNGGDGKRFITGGNTLNIGTVTTEDAPGAAWQGKSLSGTAENCVSGVTGFDVIKLNTVGWNESLPALEATNGVTYEDPVKPGASGSPFTLNLTDLSFTGTAPKAGDTMTLLSSGKGGLDGFYLKYDAGDPVKLSSKAGKTSEIVKTAPLTTGLINGAAVTTGLAHTVSLDTADNYRNVFYTAADDGKATGIDLSAWDGSKAAVSLADYTGTKVPVSTGAFDAPEADATILTAATEDFFGTVTGDRAYTEAAFTPVTAKGVTLSGDKISGVRAEGKMLKYYVETNSVRTVGTGTMAWGDGLDASGYSFAGVTSIDAKALSFTFGKEEDKAALKPGSVMTLISNARGLAADKTVTGASCTQQIDHSVANGAALSGTLTGSVSTTAGAVNYTATGMTLDSVNLAGWDGTTTSAVPTGWNKNAAGVTVNTNSMTNLPELAAGASRDILTASSGFFTFEKIEGTNKFGNGDAFSDNLNDIAVAGHKQGGIKDTDSGAKLTFFAIRKNVEDITLGEMTFADGGKGATLTSEYDATGATINADNLKFTEASRAIMETGNTMTIVDATGAIINANEETLAQFNGGADKTYSIAFSDTITGKNLTLAGTHTDTLSQADDTATSTKKSKLIYTVGDKLVSSATLTGDIAWNDGGTHYTNGSDANQNGTKATYTFDSSSAVDISGVQFNATVDPLGKSMTLLKDVNGVVATKVSGTPSFAVALDQTNTKLDAKATGASGVSGNDVIFTVSGVTLDKITVKSANSTADKVPASWTMAAGATIETDSMNVPELAAGTHVDILQSDTDGFFAKVAINGANAYGNTQETFTESDAAKSVSIAGTQDKGVTLNTEKKHLIYKAGTLDVASVTLGPAEWEKGATVFDRSGAGYNYAGVAALGTDGFAVSYASPETVAAGDSMTLVQANKTLSDMAEQVKKTSYSYTPVTGVTIDANITGKLAVSGGVVTFTAAENQAGKLTFTNVDWKDSGALMARPKNITFSGADVDTTKIHFKNVKELDANKKMTLVSDFGDSVGTITGTKYMVGAGLEGEGAASLAGSDLIFATKTGAGGAAEQTHNTLMVMEAGMAVLAAGNEHVGQAMAELGNTQNAAVDGTVTAASLGGSKSRYKTGSHVDSNSWNVAVAVGSKRELTKGSLEWGVFGEYGKSNYTLHSDAGRGDGDSHYAGGGLMAKWTNKHDVYTEASVRLGRLSDTASNLLRDAAGNGYGYDVHANYFGSHVGIGKIIHYKGGKSLDVYGKYFYTKRDGVDFTSGGNNYSLDSVASSVLRVGARYGTTDKKWNWYGGLAYEYEFDGKSEGTVDGVAIRAASVKGGSVRGEIGLRMNATKTNPWQTDISIYGYGGKHRGFGGSVNVAYMF